MNAYILAGGKSSRIKRCKAFLKIKDYYIIDIIINKLSKCFKNIFIIIKTGQQDMFKGYNNLIIEKELVSSSLVGIFTALSHTNEKWNFLIGTDMPGVKIELIKGMEKYIKENDIDIIVPSLNHYVEPLFAFYNKKILPIIKDQIRKEEFKIQTLYKKVNTLYISEKIIKKYDPELLSFLNINTKEDYKNVIKKLGN